jgi:hypothetical protein
LMYFRDSAALVHKYPLKWSKGLGNPLTEKPS